MATQLSYSRDALLRALRSFAAQGLVSAQAYEDDVSLGLTMRFGPPDEMTIEGLRPELPPRVWFHSGRAEVPEGAPPWDDLAGDPGIEVFRLYDPRTFGPLVESRGERVVASAPDWFDVAYRLDEVIGVFAELARARLAYEVVASQGSVSRLLDPEMREWVHELVSQQRTVSFHLIDGRIVEMVHQELPPDDDLITLTFDYPSDPH